MKKNIIYASGRISNHSLQVAWSGMGFGQLTMWFNKKTGAMSIDNECMSLESMRKITNHVAENAYYIEKNQSIKSVRIPLNEEVKAFDIFDDNIYLSLPNYFEEHDENTYNLRWSIDNAQVLSLMINKSEIPHNDIFSYMLDIKKTNKECHFISAEIWSWVDTEVNFPVVELRREELKFESNMLKYKNIIVRHNSERGIIQIEGANSIEEVKELFDKCLYEGVFDYIDCELISEEKMSVVAAKQLMGNKPEFDYPKYHVLAREEMHIEYRNGKTETFNLVKKVLVLDYDECHNIVSAQINTLRNKDR